jgi:limonene-1,2-epoxide hydrolase
VKRDNIEFLLGWLDALRRRDVDAVTDALAAEIVWQGVREEWVCRGPEEVAGVFAAQRDQAYEVDALELIGAPACAVLHARRPDPVEIDGLELSGGVYNLFRIHDAKITRIEDYRDRAEALDAAGLPGA